jgi:hypothetical protein
MKASLITVYVLGLLLAITFSHAQFFDKSTRLLQAADTNMTSVNITLPPDFVVINENLTLYYQFNATPASENASNATTPVTNTTNSPENATNATTPSENAIKTTTPVTNVTTPPESTTNATTPATNASNNGTTANQNNSGTIDLYLVYQGHNWFALGFNINDVTGFDYIVFEIVNETIVVSDQHSPNISLPAPDINQGRTDDWKLVNYSLNATIMIVHVTRLQNTSDPLDFVFTGPGLYRVTWSDSPSLTIQGYQGDGGRGETIVTLGNTTTVDSGTQ